MAKTVATAKAEKRRGLLSADRGIRRFMHDVRIELGKVSWPGRPEIIASTVVVIVTVTFFALYIGVLDLIFVTLIKLVST